MRISNLLSFVSVYIAVQRALGTDRLRYRCIEELGLAPGVRILDIGCGPAYYFDRFPKPVTYHGFDTHAPYIDWARRKWGTAATFHVGRFNESHASELAPFDAVLLLGLLHHLSDPESSTVLELAGSVLGPTGKVVALDTCYQASQGTVSRWMSDHDRGEYVREPEAFLGLAREHFRVVDGVVVADETRLPGSYWMMWMSDPIVRSTRPSTAD
jgi:SAM-dependent methyltransferase